MDVEHAPWECGEVVLAHQPHEAGVAHPIHAVRSEHVHQGEVKRVAAGKAEVHTRDTDLIYVLEGSARFVTGGRVVGGTNTAADEIRGEAIEGGETRVLSKGDVIIVPAGTPHWFQDVRGPVLYYTIKVRQEEK